MLNATLFVPLFGSVDPIDAYFQFLWRRRIKGYWGVADHQIKTGSPVAELRCPLSFHILEYPPGMSYDSYFAPSTSLQVQPTEGIGHGESQLERYASFSCRVCQLVSELDPRATVYILRQSTSSTMIHFLTSSISIDQPSLTETRMTGNRS